MVRDRFPSRAPGLSYPFFCFATKSERMVLNGPKRSGKIPGKDRNGQGETTEGKYHRSPGGPVHTIDLGHCPLPPPEITGRGRPRPFLTVIRIHNRSRSWL